MRSKTFLRWIISALLCLTIVWDAVLLFTRQQVTGPHKQVLFTMFLCWFITIMSTRSSDDDWAGQY